jgi:hypothetical protein
MSFIKNILAALLRRLRLLGPELVRYNDLKAFPMVNSITLSSDMNTLYLIDNGRAIPFKLQKDKMILVGLLKGQITVATSMAPDEKMEALESGTIDSSSSGALLRGGDAQKGGTVKVEVASNTQWTVAFNRGSRSMALIGAVEINPGLTSEDPDPLRPQGFLFNLNEVVVGISRIGNALILTSLLRDEEKLSS